MKEITIKLPDWAQQRLEVIKERYFTPYPKEPTEEEMILEMIADYIQFANHNEAYWKIVEILDRE